MVKSSIVKEKHLNNDFTFSCRPSTKGKSESNSQLFSKFLSKLVKKDLSILFSLKSFNTSKFPIFPNLKNLYVSSKVIIKSLNSKTLAIVFVPIEKKSYSTKKNSKIDKLELIPHKHISKQEAKTRFFNEWLENCVNVPNLQIKDGHPDSDFDFEPTINSFDQLSNHNSSAQGTEVSKSFNLQSSGSTKVKSSRSMLIMHQSLNSLSSDDLSLSKKNSKKCNENSNGNKASPEEFISKSNSASFLCINDDDFKLRFITFLEDFSKIPNNHNKMAEILKLFQEMHDYINNGSKLSEVCWSEIR
ncbi:MAG: hypothetical protein MHPSP_002321 [Paramarteilia canceri]